MKNTSNKTYKLALAASLAGLLALPLFFYYTATRSTVTNTHTPVTSVAWSLKQSNAIQSLEYHAIKSPENLVNRLRLAQAYLQEAQSTLQEAYYLPRAQAQIDKILSKDEAHFEALALQASLYNTLHQFEKARNLANTLITRAPTNAFVYGILVDALVELGQYDEAVQACDEMIRLRPGLSSYSRGAYLRELHGDTEGAIEAMKLAAEAGVSGESDRSWALYHLGQLYLGKNQIEGAALVFNGILDETPYYAYAIGGLGQIALQRGDLEGAVLLFQEAYSFVPSETFLEGIIEAHTLLGDESRVAELIEQIKAGFVAADKMGENVRMEFADFMADHNMDLETALEMAKLEYERRPNHLHALETYAWALHKNGSSEEAIPFIERAMRLGTGDAMVYYRAGYIYAETGNKDKSNSNFEAALTANLQIESPSAAATARQILKQ